MSQKKNLSRRKFLKRTAATAAAPYIIPASALGRDGTVAPSNRITLGFIGTGSHGIARNLRGFLTHADAHVLAVCDVDAEHREEAKKIVEEHYAKSAPKDAYKGCDTYNDFRELIARKDVDAIVNSTPDHWHVIPSIAAANAGKDVICEKPLSLTVAEGRALSDTMQRTGRIFQTSSENRSLKPFHRTCELVRNGRIGKLQTIHVELPKDYSIREAGTKVTDPPNGFDYDLWLGQAPEAPYCPARCHWNFRWILDYSGGMLTDWGAHMIDVAQWGNNTEYTGPVEVEGKGEFPKDGLYDAAKEFRCRYKYANGVSMTVSSSTPSIRFEGTEGWIECPGWRKPLKANPESILTSKIGPNEIHLYTCSDGEHRNFLDCVKSRKPCYAPAEVGHRTITIAHVGNTAMILGRKLKWNPDTERFVNDPEADRMLSRPMRAPWHL